MALHGNSSQDQYGYMLCGAAQRWEMHVKSTGAPTRPSAALVALRTWAGINRKARQPPYVCYVHHACMHDYPQQCDCLPPLPPPETRDELCGLPARRIACEIASQFVSCGC